MRVKVVRPFRARLVRALDGGSDYVLYCRSCRTNERCFGQLPHDVARVHAQWFHSRKVPIPVGWANP